MRSQISSIVGVPSGMGMVFLLLCVPRSIRAIVGSGKDSNGPGGTRRRLWVLIGTAAALATAIGARSLDLRYRPTLVSGPMVQIPQPGELTLVWHMSSSGAGGAWTV